MLKSKGAMLLQMACAVSTVMLVALDLPKGFALFVMALAIALLLDTVCAYLKGGRKA